MSYIVTDTGTKITYEEITNQIIALNRPDLKGLHYAKQVKAIGWWSLFVQATKPGSLPFTFWG